MRSFTHERQNVLSDRLSLGRRRNCKNAQVDQESEEMNQNVLSGHAYERRNVPKHAESVERCSEIPFPHFARSFSVLFYFENIAKARIQAAFQACE